MSSTKIDNMIKKLSEDLKKLKLATKEASKVKKAAPSKAKAPKKGSKDKKSKADRPKSIGSCSTKAQLMLFTVAELKEWLLTKKAEKISSLKKEELVKLVMKKLKKEEESSDDESSDEESSEDDCSECSSDSDSD